MPLTPLDISKKEFGRSFRGYDCEAVDSFLEELGRDYGAMFREHQEMRERTMRLEDELERFSKLEQTLKDALVIAQQAADEARKTAAQQAENIVKEAENRAEAMRLQQEQEMMAAKQQILALKEQAECFQAKMRSILRAELDLLGEFDLAEKQ